MKKLTVFFVLLLSFSFAEMSAQTIRWEVSGNTVLQIRVNGSLVVDSRSCSDTYTCPPAYGPQYGVLTVATGANVEVYAYNTSGNLSATVMPIITEDEPWMIEQAVNNDYNFLNAEHTIFQEYFTMPDEYPMYVGVNS
ncbi:MAG: hypothetical protein RLZZ540_1649 [Bacteroidota bacterium]|jgi:hypothetical protein